MINKYLYIKNNNFLRLLDNLSADYKVFTPQETRKNYFWKEYKGAFEFSKYRSVTNLRQFFTPAVEQIDNYFGSNKAQERKPICIVGAKACDLGNALKIHDYVFLEGDVDSAYKQLREKNLIISSDCTAFKETCFCLALGNMPYPEELFDLNISCVNDGYLVEIGSKKGEGTVASNKSLFETVNDTTLKERENNRNSVTKEFRCQIEPLEFPKDSLLYNLIKNGYGDKLWPEEALKCVECGACIMNCPTCHCFLLFDTKDKDGYFKGRVWDGCQYKNFTRVAGGANALRLREQRLRNRYIKKFEFFPERIKLYACTGCGRCVEGCPAKIDIRKIFKLLNENQNSAKK
ncbi:MAG: 4Fe-4S dicluster domain-containing protein [Candidatus Omnitrophica bacterium]|jgi:ferredoxin|nr:4Fe-4S dicluster domain-containing protein [Candidatus Omnitrophota bacterium]